MILRVQFIAYSASYLRYSNGIAGRHEKCGPALRTLRSSDVPTAVPSISLPQGPPRLPATRKRRETK